jgi:hypothetical protein
MISLWGFGIAEIIFLGGSTEAARARVVALDPSVGVVMVRTDTASSGVI